MDINYDSDNSTCTTNQNVNIKIDECNKDNFSNFSTKIIDYDIKKKVSLEDDNYDLIEKQRLYRIKQQKNMLEQIDSSISIAKKDKAVLSLKYDTLTFKINLAQLSIIFCSTMITFIETIKLQYELDDNISVIVPIILSTYIALISAIQRFLKWDDKKESISTILERFSFVINKCKKIKHYIINFNINDDKNKDTWNDLISNYENETYDYLIITRENFDNSMTYKELINYRKKLKNLYIEEKFLKQEISNIDNVEKLNIRKYQNKGCCGFIKFNSYLKDIEEEKINEEYSTTKKNKDIEPEVILHIDTDSDTNSNNTSKISDI